VVLVSLVLCVIGVNSKKNFYCEVYLLSSTHDVKFLELTLKLHKKEIQTLDFAKTASLLEASPIKSMWSDKSFFEGLEP